jgi:hypothetical protein
MRKKQKQKPVRHAAMRIRQREFAALSHKGKESDLPCFHRALVKAGLASKADSPQDAYQLILRVAGLVEGVTPKHKLPRVAAPFTRIIHALSLLKENQLAELRMKLSEPRI